MKLGTFFLRRLATQTWTTLLGHKLPQRNTVPSGLDNTLPRLPAASAEFELNVVFVFRPPAEPALLLPVVLFLLDSTTVCPRSSDPFYIVS